MYSYIWEFHVDPARKAEFEQAYNATGTWVQLFQKAPGYVKTELYRDAGNANRYVTVDYWQDRSALEQFRRDFADDFTRLDEACEDYTMDEKHLGDFELLC